MGDSLERYQRHLTKEVLDAVGGDRAHDQEPALPSCPLASLL